MGLSLGPFLGISILLIVIPGPDTAIVTKHALLGGRREGVFAAGGVSTGLAIWTVAAALGLATLLRASAVAFLFLKIAGTVYLLWLGVELLRARRSPPAEERPERGRQRSARRAFRQGVLSNLANPKIAVFFTSFLPQFVHAHGAVLMPLLVLGATFCLLTLSWLTVYGVLVGHGAGFLRRPGVRRALDRFTGVVLIGFGVRLAFEQR